MKTVLDFQKIRIIIMDITENIEDKPKNFLYLDFEMDKNSANMFIALCDNLCCYTTSLYTTQYHATENKILKKWSRKNHVDY